MDSVAQADIVIIGEQHDDAVGHAVQLALVEDALARCDGVAVSMEMLDREEQTVIDDYLAGMIDRDTFLENTAATKWLRVTRDYLDDEIDRETFEKKILNLGWGQWENFYQPIVDAAKDANAPVIGANTPWLRYTTFARQHGYDRMGELTAAQQRLFDLPGAESYEAYRARFWDVMVGRSEGEPPPPPAVPTPTKTSDDADGDDDADAEAAHMQLTDEQVAATFRAQLLVDATMAASIVETLERPSTSKVIHLVGQFHSDFEGGTLLEIRRRRPGVRVMVISMQAQSANELRAEDQGRADFVVYTDSPQ